MERSTSQDPRRLRELLARAEMLAQEHGLRSVLVGLSGFEGDLAFPEIVDYVESALRVDDALFRMTRERVVILLTDVDADQAAGIVARLLDEYREHYPSTSEPTVGLGQFEIGPDTTEVSLKLVLPALFATPPTSH
ncbi:MAG: diguanylate cyclase [Myxococcota bacterium]